MSRATIDYMNARREAKHSTSGGKTYARRAEYRPDSEADPFEISMAAIGAFSLWAELSRQQLCRELGIASAETVDEIPF